VVIVLTILAPLFPLVAMLWLVIAPEHPSFHVPPIGSP